jgi:hypothetical protein
MKEIIDGTDLPPIIVVERRHVREQRRVWRGGRRNADWTSRPIGAWRHLERVAPWRHWIAKLPVPGASAQRWARP